MFIYLQMIDTEEDRSKFEQIYSNYKQTMFYAANRILNDDHEAEDAVHQAFLRVIENLDKINETNCHKTKAFLVAITEHISIDIYRKRKKNNLVSYDELEEYLPDSRSEEIGRNLDIINALERLPLNYSIVLRLKFSQGYSNSEIAEFLKISEENVRQRITRAKKKLAEILESMEDKEYKSND